MENRDVALELINERTDSIELTKNKNGYAWKVKVYGDTKDSLKNLLHRIEQAKKALEARYPS